MKKIVSLMLLSIFVICLTGCGLQKNKKASTDELIKKADILDWKKVSSTITDNGAKKEDYNNKLYIYTAKVESIESDYCQLEYENPILAYLDKKTLKTLNEKDVITVIGVLTDLDDFPKLKPARKIDNKTIKKNFIFAINETSGGYKKMKYSNYVVNKKTNLITSYQTSGDENGTHTLKYDKKGNIIKDINEKTNKAYGVETVTYTYNKDNTVKTEAYSETKDSETKQGNVWEFTYEKDSKNRVIKKTGVNTTSDDKYTMIYEYEYDDNNNIKTETQISSKNTYKIEYEYDEFNNKIKEISYNIQKPTSKVVTTNTYSIIAKK